MNSVLCGVIVFLSVTVRARLQCEDGQVEVRKVKQIEDEITTVPVCCYNISCDPGTIAVACNEGDPNSSTCAPCEPGFRQETQNSLKTVGGHDCSYNSNCTRFNRDTAFVGNSTTDSVCGDCLPGYKELKGIKNCGNNNCPPGQEPLENGCHACNISHFSDTMDNLPCKRHTDCSNQGRCLSKEGNTTHDNVCSTDRSPCAVPVVNTGDGDVDGNSNYLYFLTIIPVAFIVGLPLYFAYHRKRQQLDGNSEKNTQNSPQTRNGAATNTVQQNDEDASNARAPIECSETSKPCDRGSGPQPRDTSCILDTRVKDVYGPSSGGSDGPRSTGDEEPKIAGSIGPQTGGDPGSADGGGGVGPVDGGGGVGTADGGGAQTEGGGGSADGGGAQTGECVGTADGGRPRTEVGDGSQTAGVVDPWSAGSGGSLTGGGGGLQTSGGERSQTAGGGGSIIGAGVGPQAADGVGPWTTDSEGPMRAGGEGRTWEGGNGTRAWSNFGEMALPDPTCADISLGIDTLKYFANAENLEN